MDLNTASQDPANASRGLYVKGRTSQLGSSVGGGLAAHGSVVQCPACRFSVPIPMRTDDSIVVHNQVFPVV